MTTTLRLSSLAVGVCLLSAVAADAQTSQPSSSAQASSSTSPADDTRPATTTFYGDTGLWFVPTAEVLKKGQWSASVYRRGTNYIQGYTNVGDFSGTFGYGIKGKAEIFGSIMFDTRIDRDVRPVFVADPTFGGFVDRYPEEPRVLVRQQLRRHLPGRQVQLHVASRSETRGRRRAIHGEAADGQRRQRNRHRQGGLPGRFHRQQGTPEGGGLGLRRLCVPAAAPTTSTCRAPRFDGAWAPGFRRGAHFASRRNWTASPIPAAPRATRPARFPSVDGTFPPLTVNTQNLARLTLGATYQAPKGFFVGVGGSWNFSTLERLAARSENGEIPGGDYWDWQVRIGYHPGVRKYVPPPPPPAPTPAPTPAPAPEHNLVGPCAG